MTLTLKAQWNARLKLWAEGDKLRAEGSKLWAEGDKLRAEGSKLGAECDKLGAEGGKLWDEGIRDVFGNVTIEWIWRNGGEDCKLENGEVYKWDTPIE